MDIVKTRRVLPLAVIAAAFAVTAQTAPPADIVLYASDATVRVGAWDLVADATAAGGAALSNPDLGAAKLATPLKNPAS